MSASIASRLTDLEGGIQAACQKSGRSRDQITLVLVSKRQPLDRIRAAYEAGYRDFGENYVQALVGRKESLPDDARWHMIGHLQRNKAKLAAQQAAWVHALDSLRLAQALENARRPLGTNPLPVLIEVNIAGEDSKSGIEAGALEALIDAIRPFSNLDCRGLMAPPVSGRHWFSRLRELRDATEKVTGVALPELSMGMSHDYQEAIVEGATLVRVGSTAFGPRES